MADLTPDDIEMLTGANYATFTTIDADGLPQSTIIWIDAEGEHVLVNTAKGRVKDRNVRRDPRVSVLVIREGDAYDWISVAGRVVDIEEGTFRHEDGKEVTRQWVAHPGSVAIVAHDGEHVWLVRQPREATGDPDLLELPAGKLDEDGESPLECGQRELAEEIGKAAGAWEHLTTYFTSAGFTDEQCHIYLATDLRDEPGKEVADERIDIEQHPLAGLDATIAACRDAKTLIGLLMLRARLDSTPMD